MTRKSKQAGGNFPLTHYERTKKFASSEYGTTVKRLAGHSQYQLGSCALSLTRLSKNDSVLCTPSGYLYSQESILDYLLTKTQEIKEQQVAYERLEETRAKAQADAQDRKRRAEFEESQKAIKKSKGTTGSCNSDQLKRQSDDLKRTSYWLADSQPTDAGENVAEKPPTSHRPCSPHSQEPLRRKDLWPVEVEWDDGNLICAVSGKTISTQAVTAYWTDKKKAGSIVLTSVFDDLIKDTMLCPKTSRKIKYTRLLQRSGTSFAASGQEVQVKKYRPTIT